MGEKYDVLKRTTAMLFVLVVVGSLLVGASTSDDPANRAEMQNTTFVDTTDTTVNDTVRENRSRDRDRNRSRNETERRPRGTALVRFAHMAQNASAVDVYVDGRRLNQSNALFQDLGYGNVTGYLRVPAGEHRVTVTRAGDSDARLFRGTLTFARDGRFTVAATRRANDGLQVRTFRDRIPRPGPGQAAVRVVNLAENAPPVSLIVQRPRDGPRRQNRSRQAVVQRVPTGRASQYQSVSAGFYSLDVVQAGDRDVVLASVNRSLERGTVYSVFVAGRGNGQNTAEGALDVFVNVDGVRSSVGGNGSFGTTEDGFFNGTTQGGSFNDTTAGGGQFTATTADGFFNGTTAGGGFNDTTAGGFTENGTAFTETTDTFNSS